MSVEQMRAEIAKLYHTEKWRRYVAKMPDAQVIAIYKKNLEKARGRNGRKASR